MVCPGGSAFPWHEGAGTVGGFVRRGLHHVNDFRIFWIGKDAAKIIVTEPSGILRDLLPGFTGIVGAKKSLAHQGENALAGKAGSNGETDASATGRRQTFFASGSPGLTRIGRFDNDGVYLLFLGRFLFGGVFRRRLWNSPDDRLDHPPGGGVEAQIRWAVAG